MICTKGRYNLRPSSYVCDPVAVTAVWDDLFEQSHTDIFVSGPNDQTTWAKITFILALMSVIRLLWRLCEINCLSNHLQTFLCRGQTTDTRTVSRNILAVAMTTAKYNLSYNIMANSVFLHMNTSRSNRGDDLFDWLFKCLFFCLTLRFV
jgi:hypothetical protein